jgi:hypothetical protein
MYMHEALNALHGKPQLFACRQSGKWFQMTDRHGLIHLNPKGRMSQFQPSVADIEAIDWVIMSAEQFAAFMQSLMPPAPVQESASGDN